MALKTIMALLLTATFMSACNGSRIDVPGATIRTDQFDVDIGDRRNGRGFCPPGQAKKGRC